MAMGAVYLVIVGRLLFSRAVLLVVADRADGGHLVALLEVHHLHALGQAAGLADGLYHGADDDAVLADEHQLVLGGDDAHAGQLAALFAQLHGEHALNAAAGGAVLLDRRALAHTVFGDSQHLGAFAHHVHAYGLVAGLQLDATHAAGGA